MHEAVQLCYAILWTSLFAEYYHEDCIITPFSGTFRPWESGINAYIILMQPDIPNRETYFQPHLPPNWDGWTTHEFEPNGKVTVEMALQYEGKNRTTFGLIRSGGQSPLISHIVDLRVFLKALLIHRLP